MINSLLDDRYLITAELGRGGMGIVYRARDQVLQRDVAIKVMSSSELGTDGQARLLQEARAAASLNHPNVVAVHDVGQTQLIGKSESSSYIVMELVEGELLRTYKPASLEEVIGIGCQVCAALDEAHRNNIIHRDLKPENVILTHSQVIKLMDFGLARSAGATRLTQEGALVGTLSYLAPEVILGKPATASSDLYALGVMFYELAAGRPPFQGDTLTAVISQHLHAPVVPPSVFDPHIPPALDALVVNLLSKQPEDRPKTAAQVGRDLSSIQEGLLATEPTVAAELTTLNRLVRGRLVGRESELAQATELWQRAAAGNSQVLLISGEPGIGKTRLVRELIAHAEITGGVVLSAECYSEGAVPYMPVAQVVRTAMKNGFHQQLPEAVMADLLTLAPELRVSFPDTPASLPLDPESEQSRLFESVVSLCQALTNEAALLLFMDDLHWADSGTLSLLRHLARRMRNWPLMIVATYREIDIDESRPFRDMMLDLRREQLAIRIKLSRLNMEQTRDLLATLFSEEITPELLEGIYQETEGNPFFVEEVCKALVESGELYFEDGRWHRPSMDELDIPQGVRDVIQSRVGKLPLEAQESLRLAAILGREFDFDTLAAASELDENSLIDALEMAEEAQLIAEVSARGSVSFAFAHALIPSTLVDSVRTLRRRRLHRRAAEAIEHLSPEHFEELAHHYSEAGDENQALKYYQLAGDRAAAAFANKEAETHYMAALDIVQDDDQHLAILTALGTVLSDQSRHEEAIGAWSKAIELAQLLNRMNDVADLYGRCARAAWNGGDTPRGLAFGKEGLAAVAGSQSSRGYAHLLHETARAYLFNGVLPEVEPLGRQALEMAEEVEALDVQVEALTTLSLQTIYTVDESISMLREAASLADSAGLSRESERAKYNLGTQYFWEKGYYREAIKHTNEAAQSAHARGDLTSELYYSADHIVAEIQMGNPADARTLLNSASELLDSVAEPGTVGLVYLWAEALFYYGIGDIEQAIKSLSKMAEGSRSGSDLQGLQLALNNLGEMHIAVDSLEQAAATLEEAKEHSGKGLIAGDARTYSLISLLSLKKDDLEMANDHYIKAEKMAAARNNRYVDYIWVLWARALLSATEGNWNKAWAAFEELLAITAVESRWIRAKRKLDWAEIVLTQGEAVDREKAIVRLWEAQAAFEEMGISAYVEQAANLLDKLA